jgi:hypothetical protein
MAKFKSGGGGPHLSERVERDLALLEGKEFEEESESESCEGGTRRKLKRVAKTEGR